MTMGIGGGVAWVGVTLVGVVLMGVTRGLQEDWDCWVMNFGSGLAVMGVVLEFCMGWSHGVVGFSVQS